MQIAADDDEIIRDMCGLKPARPIEASGGNRLARIEPARYSRPDKLSELQARHKLMCEYMVWGISSPVIARIVGIETDVPLPFYSAADAARVRRREARRLVNDPLFRKVLAEEIRNYRQSRAGAAILTIEDVMTDVGENKAADRKVRLTAAGMMLGDAIGQPEGASRGVNVNIGFGLTVSPGLVIDLSPARPVHLQEVDDLTIGGIEARRAIEADSK